MSGINGWRFCELLHTQRISSQPVPPVLVVSATYSGMDAEVLLADMGASAFLTLPANPARIREQVRQLLEEPSVPMGFHVWMVSSNNSEIERIRSVFVERGWQVHEWHSGADMQAASALTTPDIIIVDNTLADMTTDDLLSWCKRERQDLFSLTPSRNPLTRQQIVSMGKRYLVGVTDRISQT